MTAEPTNVCSNVALVAARSPVLELKVRLVPVLAGKLPVVPVANNTLQVSSDDSSASVMFVAFVEVPVTSPVTLPVKFPEKVVDVVTPVANTLPSGLNVIPDPTCAVLVKVETPVILRFLPVISSYVISPATSKSPPILTRPVTVRIPTVVIPVANISPSGLSVMPDPTITSLPIVDVPDTFIFCKNVAFVLVLIFSVPAEPTTVAIPVEN